jgi:TRAP-type mannitol/chloroaromatic compound transport system substrate-binding protein
MKGVIIFYLSLTLFVLFICSAGAETIGDVDGNNQIGLEESIYSLQVLSGLKASQTEQIILNVKPIYHSSLNGLGNVIEWVRDMIDPLSKSRVKINLVNIQTPSDQILSNVSDGTLQAVHGYAGLHLNQIPAAEIFGSFPFGPDATEYLSWIWYGNGLNLWQQLYDDSGFNVKVIPCGITTAETGGWYKNPIDSIDDFDGLTMRACGLGALVLQKLGAITTCYNSNQIINKFQDGSITGAEFSIPSVDDIMAFHTVADYNYFPGWHQKAILLELIINKDIWNNLTPYQQMTIEVACKAVTLDNILFTETIQSQYIKQNETYGVQNLYFSDDILNGLKSAAFDVMTEQSNADTAFQTVWEDYKQFHENYFIWSSLGHYPRHLN